MAETRQCGKCRETKSADAFDNGRVSDGRVSRKCEECYEAEGRGRRAQVDEPSSVETATLAALKKLGDTASVEDIANYADIAPRRVREALAALGHQGYQLVEAPEGLVTLQKIARPSEIEHQVLFSGDTYRFAIISDVHLNSKHCRLDELHMAYDTVVSEGIDTVYNPGDIVAGRGIFRGQDHEILNHTFESQKAYAIENYPVRPGVKTKIISGNHDCEGDFGRAGADACAGVANERPDIDWCGMYAADFVLPNGAIMTMRHPMGGSSYAKSYKPQKFAESFEGGSKPAIVLFGHWHNYEAGFHRNIYMLNCGTFEGYGGTLGLRVPLGAPAVGFTIAEATLGDDGSLVRFTHTWMPFYAGRRMGQGMNRSGRSA
jgi:predicted phosphodiesterase